MACMMNAFAKHDNGLTEQQRQWMEASMARRDEAQRPQPYGQRDPREARQSENSPDEQRGGYAGQPQQDEGRRGGGRMSPEERRELRRQINEAGRNIYGRDR